MHATDSHTYTKHKDILALYYMSLPELLHLWYMSKTWPLQLMQEEPIRSKFKVYIRFAFS